LSPTNLSMGLSFPALLIPVTRDLASRPGSLKARPPPPGYLFCPFFLEAAFKSACPQFQFPPPLDPPQNAPDPFALFPCFFFVPSQVPSCFPNFHPPPLSDSVPPGSNCRYQSSLPPDWQPSFFPLSSCQSFLSSALVPDAGPPLQLKVFMKFKDVANPCPRAAWFPHGTPLLPGRFGFPPVQGFATRVSPARAVAGRYFFHDSDVAAVFQLKPSTSITVFSHLFFL